MKNVVLGAGRYFFGDVTGRDALVSVPCRACLFYTDAGDEIEVASGGSSCYDESVIGALGVIGFDEISGGADFDECVEFTAGGLVFELSSPAVVTAENDFFESAGVCAVSFARENGLNFLSTENDFENAGC